MTIKTIKHLELSLDNDGTLVQAECQLSTARLEDNAAPESLTSFCGVHNLPGVPEYQLVLSGWQDYGEAESVFDLIHTAYKNSLDPSGTGASDIDCVLTVGKATRTFTATPTADVPFGGDAGILTADTTLSVTSDVVDGVVP